MTRGRFSIDGDDASLDGWWDPRALWNGWAQPRFDRVQLAAVLARLEAMGLYRVTPVGDALRFEPMSVEIGEQPFEVALTTIETDAGKRVEVYDLSLGLCWWPDA